MQSTENKKGMVRVILILGVVAAAGFVLLQRRSPNTIQNPLQGLPSLGTPAPTPEPFAELTIPYLRNREYKSSLTGQTRIGENATYESFLASYDSDGLKINGLLTVPKGEAPEGGWPAIVFVHGYIAPTIYETRERYVSYVDTLARSGFVVFKIDLRGHADSEGEPGGAYYSSDYVIDTLNAQAALKSSDFVHPEKIGLWGHSMAGNVTFRSLAVQPNIPAVVIWGGAGFSYTDLAKYQINDNSYRPPSTDTERVRKRQQLRDTYGDPAGGNPFWAKVAPTNYLSDIKGAVQLHHAVNDTVVNVGYSRDLAELLKSANITHELFTYPSGGHDIEGGSFGTAMSRTIAFYKTHLQVN